MATTAKSVHAARVPDEARRWWETFSSGAARVSDEARRWWETFNKGVAVDEEGEPEMAVDSDSSFEQEEELQNSGPVASESDREMAAGPVAMEESGGGGGGGGTDTRHSDEEEASGDCDIQLQGRLFGRKRKAITAQSERQATGTEIQDEKEYVAEDNYAPISGGLQGRKREATVTPDKLQPTTGTKIHDKNCYHQVAEEEEEEEENAGVAASDGKMTAAAHARVKEPSNGCAADCMFDVDCCSNAEEEVSEDDYVQLQGGLLGRKKKAIVAHAELQTIKTEIQDEQGHEEEVSEDCYVQLQGSILLGRKRKAIAKQAEPQTSGTDIREEKGHEEYIAEDNYVHIGGGLQGRKRKATARPDKLQRITATEIHEKSAQGKCLRAEMLNELEVQQIQRLKLELNLMTKEIKSLKQQNEELRTENEHYRKTAKQPQNPRLCRSCNQYVLGNAYRNCPKRRASASSEHDVENSSN